MAPHPHFILPGSVADAMAVSGAPWGSFGVKYVPGEELYVISWYTRKQDVKLPASTPWLDSHYSRGASVNPGIGFWYRADADLTLSWEGIWHRRVSVPIDAFREHIRGWQAPGNATVPVLTVTEIDGAEVWRAWLINNEIASPLQLEVVSESTDIYSIYRGVWPLDLLAGELVTVIGAGSIGSAVAEGLIEYGIRKLALVDYDRLQFHNLARHRLLAKDIGRLKVTALRDFLLERDPKAQIDALPFDVTEDANMIRPLLKQSNLLIVTSDGVASRRAANHLASWAGTPTIFACVLEDGGIGEILRVKPGVTSCLLCFREKLAAEGSLDPEPDIDRGYGTGNRHLLMTAVGGDLDLVGKLAAKAAVATLLERRGYLEQRLPGDHAVLGLQPPLALPAPFDVSRAGEIKWSETGSPRANCPSCRAI